jgi:DNA helicase HerA-like ATPase
MAKRLQIALNCSKKLPIALEILLNLVNRHGCITGATGTGKTVTLQVMTETLSDIGVPIFIADIKGDLSGLAVA